MKLAELVRMINRSRELPQYIALLYGDWIEIRSEVEQIQHEKGEPLFCADIDRINFLVRGIPIVMRA